MSEFRITGPGEYKTRDGRWATVFGRHQGFSSHTWGGIVNEAQGMFASWSDTGVCNLGEGYSGFDIISKWEEPVTEPQMQTEHTRHLQEMRMRCVEVAAMEYSAKGPNPFIDAAFIQSRASQLFKFVMEG